MCDSGCPNKSNVDDVYCSFKPTSPCSFSFFNIKKKIIPGKIRKKLFMIIDNEIKFIYMAII